MRTPAPRLALCLLIATAGWIGAAAPAFAAEGPRTQTDEEKALMDYIRSLPQPGAAVDPAQPSPGVAGLTQPPAPASSDLIFRKPNTSISCLGGGPRDNCAPKQDYYRLQSFFGAAKTAPGTAFDGSKPGQGGAPPPSESKPDPAASVPEPSSVPVPPAGGEAPGGGDKRDLSAPRAQLPESLKRKSGAPPSPEAGAAAPSLTVSNKKDEGKKGVAGWIGGVFDAIGSGIKSAFTWVVNAAKSVGGWVSGLFTK